MKKWIIPVIIIAVIGFGIYNWAVGFNNTAIELNENVSEAWGNVQTSYQRRNDLIGNLVNTVKGAADFEKSTLEAVIKARSEATKTTIDPSNITPEQLEQFNQAQGGLSSALSRLLVTVERYPELKANQNFLKLQDELTSTENTIQTARTRYNEAIKPYNNHVKKFPNSILAGMFDFEGKPYFDAEAGAEKPVDVEFDFN
ncbi:MAG: LemA family protein [Xanthomarina sp.]|jgi:LemA protein|uniref:LemA family protein n=1 Tax=Xanthomarina TaxID=1868329 RepID=UPI000C62EE40|nr:LemA family protein [Xanthomarina sp.]MAL24125.1 LemA family protein [Xanthomarina sp.]MBF61404.1 LemA family protein [Xanthomarina sp.]HAB27883.1 LemA family protein [Xanthomarina gelatinilytica]HAI17416.1 LemA family protein [Xanthomarina gelatinilytica]|tara:strand:+ start:1114 stop:1713 length:600 start_codon:yes stop_codon:yes gene_type:complete